MSTSSGKLAEDAAAQYLRTLGYSIRDQNWRTRYCEIDIVAEKNKIIWSVEVKYRRQSGQGFGYEYVTPKKLQQMQFAAELWVQAHAWEGDYRLAVVSVDGDQVTFIDEL